MQPEVIADRYRVLRAIGRGGMGTVWLCVDEVLGREVAVKQIRPPQGEESDGIARAMREARVAAALNHRHAVSVYDVVKSDNTIWLVMEHIPSRNLAELVAEEGPLTPERTAGIGAQVAEALAAAHALGIIHRDVKPANILVSAGDAASIGDFGISRGAHDTTLTRTGLLTGTPGYFSPELARGDEPTKTADVWALGITLYHAVEGAPPYDSTSNPLITLGQIVNELVPEPVRAGPLEDVLAALLDRDVAARATMLEAAVLLREVASGGTTAPGAVGALGAGGASGSAGASDASDAAASAGPSTAPASAQPEPAEEDPPTSSPLLADAFDDQPHDEPAPERERSTGRWVAVGAAVVALLLAGWLLTTMLDGDDPNDVGGTGTQRSQSGGPDSQSQQTEPTMTTDAAETTESEPSTPSSTDETTETEETTETTETTKTTKTTETSEPPLQPREAQISFVTSYFSVLPEDLDAGWAQLSPEFQQSLGRASYDGFWETLTDVSVTDVRPLGDGRVDYTVTYDPADGPPETEFKQLVLVSAGDSFLINDDG